MIEHGQWGAYWIPPHLTKPLAQPHFFSVTCLAASPPFLSSFRSQLLPPSDCNFCWRHIFHLDFSFSAFGFLTSSNFAFLSDNLGAYWILPHLTKPLAQIRPVSYHFLDVLFKKLFVIQLLSYSARAIETILNLRILIIF